MSAIHERLLAGAKTQHRRHRPVCAKTSFEMFSAGLEADPAKARTALKQALVVAQVHGSSHGHRSDSNFRLMLPHWSVVLRARSTSMRGMHAHGAWANKGLCVPSQIFESVDDAAMEALSLPELALKLKSTDIDVSRSAFSPTPPPDRRASTSMGCSSRAP
jgi:hypothetical protein